MDAKNNGQRTDLMKSLASIAKKKLSKSQAAQFEQFVVSAMHFYPDADYLNRPVEDIFCSLWGLLDFSAAAIVPAEGCHAALRVFNPSPESEGWSSLYTSIYINQRDMPFLVDSLRIVLNRRGLNIYTLQSNPMWAVRKESGLLQSTHKDYTDGAQREALISIEVDRHSESELADLHLELMAVLDDVEVVVDGFDPMRQRVDDLIAELQENAPELEDLEESLTNIGFKVGRTYDPSVLDEIERSLIDQYFSFGKYSAKIDTIIEDLPGNTVTVKVDVKEGDRAQIRQINIVGNNIFNDEDLLDLLKLKMPNWLSFINQDDRYSREDLQGDLEGIESFYLDQGYANFQIESAQVAISQDKTGIFVKSEK
mgnify:CR=1 FL=1